MAEKTPASNSKGRKRLGTDQGNKSETNAKKKKFGESEPRPNLQPSCANFVPSLDAACVTSPHAAAVQPIVWEVPPTFTFGDNNLTSIVVEENFMSASAGNGRGSFNIPEASTSAGFSSSLQSPVVNPLIPSPEDVRGKDLQRNNPGKKRSCVAAEKVAGKRRRNRSKSPTLEAGIDVAVVIESGNGHRPIKKNYRLTRCSKEGIQSCEVCSKPDYMKCSNCMNKSKRHQACKEKPKEKCQTYIRKHGNGDTNGQTRSNTSSVSSTNSLDDYEEDSEVSDSGSNVVDDANLLDNTDPSDTVDDVEGMRCTYCALHKRTLNSIYTDLNVLTNRIQELEKGISFCVHEKTSPSSSNVPPPQPGNNNNLHMSTMSSVASTTSDHELNIIESMEDTELSHGNDVPSPVSSVRSKKLSTVSEPQNIIEPGLVTTNPPSPVPPSPLTRHISDNQRNLTTKECRQVVAKMNVGFTKTVKVHITKCAVSGPPGTGKSHFRALMLGLGYPNERRSTSLATEADEVITDNLDSEEFVNINPTAKGEFNWTVVKKPHLTRLLANTIHGLVGSVDEETEATVCDGDAFQAGKPDEQNCDEEMLRIARSTYQSILSQLKDLHNKPWRKRKTLSNIHLLYFVDTGGQTQFQEILPNFVRSYVNLLVHNMSQSLSHCPQFSYVLGNDHFQVPERLSVSNLEMIAQSIRSVCSTIFTGAYNKRNPKVAIIGTFKDMCNADTMQKDLEKKSTEITSCLGPLLGKGATKCELFSPDRDIKQVIFSIDGSRTGWNSNGAVVEKLRGWVHENSSIEIEIPIKYFVFLHNLKTYAKKKDISYLTMDECEKFALQCLVSMGKEDVKKALLLFSNVHLILYFPDFPLISNLVFLKPSFLYEKVSDLIAASFNFSNRNTQYQDLSKNFHDTGIFKSRLSLFIPSFRMLQHGPFTVARFFYLLQRLFIIAKLSLDDYFMPCVLPLAEKTSFFPRIRDIQHRMTENQVEGPLVISFADKVSPRGLFCSVIVKLTENFGWKLCIEDQDRYRNMVAFTIQDIQSSQVTGRAIIIDQMTHFEVYTTCQKQDYPSVRYAVYSSLHAACTSMQYSLLDLDMRVGFRCPRLGCQNAQPMHHTTCFFHGKKTTWVEKCTVLTRASAIPLTPSRLVWFVHSSIVQPTPENNAPSTQEIPSLALLLNEVTPHTNKWDQIAINLELTWTEIERIRNDSDEIRRFTRVFDAWKKLAKKPFTWNTLVEVLRAPIVMELRLANDIEQKYIINLK